MFEATSREEDAAGLIPPKDYAVKQSPDQIGALSEDFGIEKSKSVADEEIPIQPAK